MVRILIVISFLFFVARLSHQTGDQFQVAIGLFHPLHPSSVPRIRSVSLTIFLHHSIQIIVIILRTLHSHCPCFIALHLCCFLHCVPVENQWRRKFNGKQQRTEHTAVLEYEKKLTATHIPWTISMYLYVLWQFCVEIEWVKCGFDRFFGLFCVCVSVGEDTHVYVLQHTKQHTTKTWCIEN